MKCTHATRACYMLGLVVTFSMGAAAERSAHVAALLALTTAAFLADMAWWLRCRKSAPGGSSYARWRDVLPLLISSNHVLLGAGRSLVLWTRALPADAVDGGGGWLAAAQYMFLVLHSGHVFASLTRWLLGFRVSFMLPSQLLETLALARYHGALCATPLLASPAVQAMTKRAYTLLGALRFTCIPQAAGRALALPPAGKCSAVLTYSRLLLGVLLPAALEAATELRLYREHQRERRLAGLPAERCSGTQARLYAVLGRLRDALHGPTAVVAVWVAMGLLFDLVLVLAQ